MKNFWRMNELYFQINNLFYNKVHHSKLHALKSNLEWYIPRLAPIPEESVELGPPTRDAYYKRFANILIGDEMTLKNVVICIQNFTHFRIYRSSKKYPFGKLLFIGDEEECIQFLKYYSQFGPLPVTATGCSIINDSISDSSSVTFTSTSNTEFLLFRRIFLILRINYDLTFR
jgi:hypothetical protein